tara:strand:- start:720 stop:1022 length:303 start_codon:yes stop_codon:yes gene_type:complete
MKPEIRTHKQILYVHKMGVWLEFEEIMTIIEALTKHSKMNVKLINELNSIYEAGLEELSIKESKEKHAKTIGAEPYPEYDEENKEYQTVKTVIDGKLKSE